MSERDWLFLGHRHDAGVPGEHIAGYVQRSKTPLAAQTWRSMFLPTITMEKPTVRGPSPGRKAVHALGAKLNRKPKRPPPLPSKKNVSNAVRLVNR